MNQKKIYTTGDFAKKANVTVRTIRYYDKAGLLKPSHVSDNGYRLYTDSDFAKLQKILALKYFGFSIEQIVDITMNDKDLDYVEESFALQLELIRKKIENFEQMAEAIEETSRRFEKNKEIDWRQMLQLIHVISMEKDLADQYKNEKNTKTRIDLHRIYSQNPIPWFQWIFEKTQIKQGERILEIGCGNGELWKVNQDMLPKGCQLILTDNSSGMLQDAKATLKKTKLKPTFYCRDCQELMLEPESVDVVIANHVMFYIKDQDKALSQIHDVLVPGGKFVCSTYGQNHMYEMNAIVKEFDERIVLSEINLSEVFGLEDAERTLKKYFSVVEKHEYDDSLIIDEVQPIADYILSCHGNQKEYLYNRYEEFLEFLEKKKSKKGFIKITKQAGLFICKKEAL